MSPTKKPSARREDLNHRTPQSDHDSRLRGCRAVRLSQRDQLIVAVEWQIGRCHRADLQSGQLGPT